MNLVRGAADPPQEELQVKEESWVADEDVQAAGVPRVAAMGSPSHYRRDAARVKVRSGQEFCLVGLVTIPRLDDRLGLLTGRKSSTASSAKSLTTP
jgi:hypothetical protein